MWPAPIRAPSKGGDGDDSIFGVGGNDNLFGGGDNDDLFGDKGNDTINGGSGKNTLTGGDGKDVFQVDDDGKGTKQTITDFDPNEDTINLQDFNTKFSDLKFSNDGDGVLIQVKGSKTKIFVEGFDKNDPNKKWFEF
jgi:Ca2+-binding RTX toxin-like protein